MSHLPKLKRFGQHFLTDPKVLEGIVRVSDLSVEDTVIEIGTGDGVLTEALAQQVKYLITVEIDLKRFEETKARLSHLNNVTWVCGDFLKLSLDEYLKVPVKVVANIPYYITAPIIERLFDYKTHIQSIVLMVQKEVADRMASGCGNKTYGSFSVFCQYHATVVYQFTVGSYSFSPPPKVSSAVVKLIPKKSVLDPKQETFFFKVVKAVFWARRKTLVNCLTTSPHLSLHKELVLAVMGEMGIDEKIRGDQLSIEQIILLSEQLDSLMH